MAKVFNKDDFDVFPIPEGFTIRERSTNLCYILAVWDRLNREEYFQKNGTDIDWEPVYAVVSPLEFVQDTHAACWKFLEGYDTARIETTVPLEAKGYIKRGFTLEQAKEYAFVQIEKLLSK